jgi:histidinol-phosphate aminotransferase
MPIEFAARVKRIPVYPAADGYAHPGPLTKLASNESPFPPLPAVVDAAQQALGGANRYPDPTNSRLRAALADRTGVPAGRIAIGNGSCDILLAAGEALLEPGAEVVYAWPSFSVYPHLAAASGATAIEVPLDAEDRHDLDAMAAEVTAATRLVVVCNPNNPTSTALPLAEIEAFLATVPRHVAVILDEAYVEFNVLQTPEDSIPLLGRHPNLVLLRTFSKVYGLCGLRVGYGLCGDEAFRIAVDQVRQPFFCNAAAQAAAVEALRHGDEVSRRIELTVAERLDMDDELRARGYRPAASQANFCWFQVGEDAEEEQRVVRGLAEQGIVVRAGTPLGREGHLRVTYGLPEENARFLAALDALR